MVGSSNSCCRAVLVGKRNRCDKGESIELVVNERHGCKVETPGVLDNYDDRWKLGRDMRLYADLTMCVVKDIPWLVAYRVVLAKWQLVAKQRKVGLVRRASSDHRFSVY